MRRSVYTLRTSLALLIGVLLVCFLALHIDSRLSFQYEQRLRNEVREDMIRRASLVSASIEKQVSLLRGLEAYVRTRIEQEKPIAQEGFLLAVKTLTEGSETVRNMIIAPEGINTFVYPIEGNEAAVGHDLLSDERPEVQMDIARALNTRELTLSGPYQLRQGGLGLVARKALFEDGEFWGLVTMVIDMPQVLLEADLYCGDGSSVLCTSPVLVALSDQKAVLISGNESLLDSRLEQDPISVTVSLPEGSWEILAAPVDGWASGYPVPLRVLLYLSAGLMITLFVFLYLQARWLRQQVEQKTESLRIETEANRRQSMLLERTLRSIDEGVVITDAAGRVSSTNMKALEMCGSPDGVIGSPFQEVYPIIDSGQEAVSEAIIKEVLEHREPYQSLNEQLKLSCVYRTPLPIEVSASPILLEEGAPVGIIIILHDVSYQREASRQLQNAQKLESLGHLAGGIAHDFNNLLGGIFGFIELAASAADDPEEVRHCLKQALDTLPKVKLLTGELLTFSKGGSPVKSPTDVLRLLEEACGFLDDDPQISLTFKAEEPLWECLADPDQLMTVFTQLLKNAQSAICKRGGAGSVVIEVSDMLLPRGSDPLLDAPACLKISISDTGCGISPEDLDKVFDPFFTTGEFGSGLGLTVAYSIIRSHGGDIRISSDETKGTLVQIFLPALSSDHTQLRVDQRPPVRMSRSGEI